MSLKSSISVDLHRMKLYCGVRLYMVFVLCFYNRSLRSCKSIWRGKLLLSYTINGECFQYQFASIFSTFWCSNGGTSPLNLAISLSPKLETACWVYCQGVCDNNLAFHTFIFIVNSRVKETITLTLYKFALKASNKCLWYSCDLKA